MKIKDLILENKLDNIKIKSWRKQAAYSGSEIINEFGSLESCQNDKCH